MVTKKVQCRICRKSFQQLYTHLHKHNISRENYLKKYPKAKISSDSHLLKISKGHFTFYKKNPKFRSKYYKSHPEVKKKISKSVKRLYKEHPEIIEQISVSTKKALSKPGMRKKLSKQRRKYFKEHPEAGKQISKRQKWFYKKHPEAAKWHSKVMEKLFIKHPEKRKQYSKLQKKIYKEHPEYWEKMGKTRLIYFEKHPEWGKMMSKIKKRFFKEHPEAIKKWMEMMNKSLNIKPNKAEQILINLFKKHKINFRYVGDYSLSIGRLNPDFVNKKKKKIIEHFGVYWHGKKRLGINRKKHEKDKIKEYSKYGYRCLVIWEDELRDINAVLKKVKEFYHRK